MPKWKKYIAEASPIAIVAFFLIVIAANPNISPPNTGSSFGHLIKEYFLQDTLTRQNIINLLEQIRQPSLTKLAHAPPPPNLKVPPPSRARTMTTVDLKILKLDNTEKGNLPVQLDAMRKHEFEATLTYEMIKK